MAPYRLIRLATRGSALAVQQSMRVGELILETGLVRHVVFHEYSTQPDRDPTRPLHEMGDKGLFVKEIEEALLAGKDDAGIHSLKDLPGDLPPGLKLAAVPEREDPRDALLSRNGLTLSQLPRGAVVATSSLRRRGQLLRLRLDLQVVPLRGNVDTRVRKLRAGEFDAMILAVAGLKRLGFENEISEILPLETMLPASAQGALGIEVPVASRGRLEQIWRAIDNPEVRLCAEAEREFVRLIGADCQTPVGCHCELGNGEARLRAMVCSPDGLQYISTTQVAPSNELGTLPCRAADDLISQGAEKIIAAARL